MATALSSFDSDTDRQAAREREREEEEGRERERGSSRQSVVRLIHRLAK